MNAEPVVEVEGLWTAFGIDGCKRHAVARESWFENGLGRGDQHGAMVRCRRTGKDHGSPRLKSRAIHSQSSGAVMPTEHPVRERSINLAAPTKGPRRGTLEDQG